MISVDRTVNPFIIAGISTHPAIYGNTIDDGAPPANDYDPTPLINMEGVYFLLAKKDDDMLGLFSLIQQNFITYEGHVCMFPKAWGRDSIAAGRMAIEWMIENTSCRKIIVNVPTFNKRAIMYAQLLGLRKEGINTASFLRGGKVFDQVMLGITAEDIPWHK